MSPQAIVNENCNNSNNNNVNLESEEARELAILKQIIESQMAKYLPPTQEELEQIDARSIYVGNVDWHSTAKEIEEHFDECGKVVRVTIPKDKFTGRQRNFAYVEYEDISSVQLALVLNGSSFRNRKIFVSVKRTNKPGMGSSSTTIGGAPRPPIGRQVTQKTTKEVKVVKYVYINAQKPVNGSRSKRFTPY